MVFTIAHVAIWLFLERNCVMWVLEVERTCEQFVQCDSRIWTRHGWLHQNWTCKRSPLHLVIALRMTRLVGISHITQLWCTDMKNKNHWVYSAFRNVAIIYMRVVSTKAWLPWGVCNGTPSKDLANIICNYVSGTATVNPAANFGILWWEPVS